MIDTSVLPEVGEIITIFRSPQSGTQSYTRDDGTYGTKEYRYFAPQDWFVAAIENRLSHTWVKLIDVRSLDSYWDFGFESYPSWIHLLTSETIFPEWKAIGSLTLSKHSGE